MLGGAGVTETSTNEREIRKLLKRERVLRKGATEMGVYCGSNEIK
jgi:hypothetical protein